MKDIYAAILLFTWIAGTVLAKGFWLTTLSVCIPLYAWYLFVERLMVVSGFGI